MIKKFNSDNLNVKVFETRFEMGIQAANEAIECIKILLSEKENINIVFAAAPSQNDFLTSLSGHTEIDWSRVNAFHMDEYIGLAKEAPQGFGNFLKNAIFEHLPFRNVFYLYSEDFSTNENCNRYENLLKEYPTDIVFMGIGENGHIAFNDPHVASFTDSSWVKVIDLGIESRQQQVNDGCFETLDAVPTHAMTLTIPALMSAKYIFCIVPTERKAKAVKETIEGPINEKCPATILRSHSAASLYIDISSAELLNVAQ